MHDEIARIRALAAKLRLWTVLGAQQPAAADGVGVDGGRPRTSLLIIDPAGEVVGRYDERILSRSKQTYLYAAGDQRVW